MAQGLPRDDGSFPWALSQPPGRQSGPVHGTPNSSQESQRTSSGGQTFQASACVTFADVLLVKASRAAKPRQTGWESRPHPDGRSMRSHGKEASPQGGGTSVAVFLNNPPQ